MNIKILQIGMTKNIGGIENYLINQFKFLNKENIMYDFVNITGEHPMVYSDYLRLNGSTVYNIISRHKNPVKHYLQWFILLLKKRKDYKAIVLNSNGLTYIYPLVLARLFGIPIRIIHSHNSNYPFHLNFKKKLLIKFNKFLLRYSATHYWACSVNAGKWMFGENKSFQVIHNAIDSKEYLFNLSQRISVRKRFNLENQFVLGHVGSFNYQKNHDFLIDIFYEVVKLHPNSTLLLIGGDGGNPNIFNSIKEKINKLKLENNILFLGMRRDVSELMQGMDCFVFPSRYEGLPLVGIEAQAAGLDCFFSGNITRELKITSLAHFIPLETSSEEWAHNILKVYKRSNRINMHQQIVDAGYDIQCEIQKIKKFYCDRLR